MKKYFSLIKASMSEGMNIYRISTKNKSNVTKILLPVVLTLFIIGSIYTYADTIFSQLETVNMQALVLSLFIIITSLLTLIEGVYKSGNLLFNCKDDNLLLSLPIRKSTVLFIRILKFYLFEIAYNSLFLLPAIIVYAVHMKPDITYYIVSIIGLLLFPIVPILVSSLIGTIITFISSKFKGKNMVQTILTIAFILGIMYISSNYQQLLTDITNNAANINNFITNIYYPAGAYINLVNEFNILKLLEFIAVNLALSIITILIIGRVYFNINSNVKSMKTKKSNKAYKITTSSPISALIKKEFSRFINSTVFVTNAGFGLVLFILGCILLIFNYDNIANMITQINPNMTIEYTNSIISILLFALIASCSFMTSITSSMISLEGKSLNILKSLPLKVFTIVESKVLTAILIMFPCILLGDVIIFTTFSFDAISILLTLIASILFPLLTETIGIIVNLKYPRMDAQNDTEVVKQSMSSSICVFIGMALVAITCFLLFKGLELLLPVYIVSLSVLTIYAVIQVILTIILYKTCNKNFNNISV